jgi:hypothetical protein
METQAPLGLIFAHIVESKPLAASCACPIQNPLQMAGRMSSADKFDFTQD